MIGVVKTNPGLRLTVKPLSKRPKLKGHVRADLPKSLYQELALIASDYGMEMPELTRVFLKMALDFHKKLVPEGEISSKEDLIEKINRAVRQSE